MFVVDANVLLGFYRYPKQAQDDLLRALKALAGRLWIPHQVALEFQENRLDVFQEQLVRYDQVKNTAEQARSDIHKKLDAMQLKARHSTINPKPFLDKLDQLVEAFGVELAQLRKQHEYRGEDATRKAIDTLLEGRVGNPLTQDELDGLYKDGAKRYEQRRPPGYLDKGKDKEKTPLYFYKDLIIRRAYGDLIIWEQTIKEANSRKSQSVVIITEDRSEDWWWVHNGKTIGPRPELTGEISTRANVSFFHMYRLDRFLEYSRQYLGADVKEDSVVQVRDIAHVSTSGPSTRASTARRLEMATNEVFNWLTSLYGKRTVTHNDTFPDFLVRLGRRGIGYDVKVPASETVPVAVLTEWIRRADIRLGEHRPKRYDSVIFVVVFANENDARQFLLLVPGLKSSDSKVNVIAGYLETDGSRFVPINGDDAPLDYTWLCGNCRSFGPWDGARCLTCGQMSED